MISECRLFYSCLGPSSVYVYIYIQSSAWHYHLAGFKHLDWLQERSHLTNFVFIFMVILLLLLLIGSIEIICLLSPEDIASPIPPVLVVQKLHFSSSQESSADQDCWVGNDFYLASVIGSDWNLLNICSDFSDLSHPGPWWWKVRESPQNARNIQV